MADQLEPAAKNSRSDRPELPQMETEAAKKSRFDLPEQSQAGTEMMIETQKKEYDDYEFTSIDKEEWGSKENMIRYIRQVEESDGFDVDDFSYSEALGLILPQPQTNAIRQHYKRFAEFALDEYNKTEKTNYKFDFLEKVNVRGVSVDELYLTFRAVDPDGKKAHTFQALVNDNEARLLRNRPAIFLDFCRLKDPTKLGVSSRSTCSTGSQSAAESNAAGSGSD